MRTLKTIAALAVVSTLAALPALALGPVSLTAKADYASKYVWRGYDLSGDGDAFQPSLSASVTPLEPLTLSLGIWANYDVDFTKEWNEIDYTASAAYKVNDLLTLSGGYIFYAFPKVDDSDGNDTKEFYAGASFALPMNLAAGLTAYYDHDDGKGFYVLGSLDYTRALSETATFTTGASVGYMSYDDDSSLYLDEDGDGLSAISDINLRAGLSANLGSNLTLAVTAVYTIVPEDAVNEDNEFWALTSLAYAF